MRRFVILHHQMPDPSTRATHWDLMLEAGKSLRTWALIAEPAPGKAIPAQALPDHRREYLTYEGPISGGRGAVVQWDSGGYQLLKESPRSVTIELHGARLKGIAVLTACDQDEAADQWTLSLM